MTKRVIVIGAGAAGSMAAIFAATAGAETVLIERTRDGGRKILISGGGRCNITHDVITAADFFGRRNIVKNILAAFSVEQTVQWFA